MARTIVEADCHGGPGCFVDLTQLSQRAPGRQTDTV